MTNWTRRRLTAALLVANIVFWGLCWGYILVSSEPAPTPLALHLPPVNHNHPNCVSVFGRWLPEGLPRPAKSLLTVQLPSLVTASFLVHCAPEDVVWLQTNRSGLKLLMTTMLSFVQWYLVGVAAAWLVHRRVRKSQIVLH